MVAVVSNPVLPCLSLETPATSPSPARSQRRAAERADRRPGFNPSGRDETMAGLIPVAKAVSGQQHPEKSS